MDVISNQLPLFRGFRPPYKTPRPLYILEEDFQYRWKDDSGLIHQFIIPRGYITDKASVPQIFWSLGFSPEGLHEAAALIHDYLYQHKGDPNGTYTVFSEGGTPYEITKHFTRAEVDKLFLNIMLSYGVSPGKARTMYYAVRTCGGFSGGWNW